MLNIKILNNALNNNNLLKVNFIISIDFLHLEYRDC